MLKQSTIPAKYDRKISATSFYFENIVSFSTSAIFSPFSVFSMKHGFMVFQKDLFIIDNLANAKVIIKVPFCLLNKCSTKIALPFIL